MQKKKRGGIKNEKDKIRASYTRISTRPIRTDKAIQREMDQLATQDELANVLNVEAANAEEQEKGIEAPKVYGVLTPSKENRAANSYPNLHVGKAFHGLWQFWDRPDQ
ncbi:hypothetical protein BGX34_004046 [Mortierella sp. NVP85]|nr:hypothetical protein BGX34_004046 [Mortierella sp. NVP85]